MPIRRKKGVGRGVAVAGTVAAGLSAVLIVRFGIRAGMESAASSPLAASVDTQVQSGTSPDGPYIDAIDRDFGESGRGHMSPERAVVEAPVEPVMASGLLRQYTHQATAFDRAPALRLSGQPVVTVGGADLSPEYDLTTVRAIALLHDGSVVVAAANPARVMTFTPQGVPERLVATEGEGPGQMRFMDGLAVLPDDHILMVDGMNNRVTISDRRGHDVRTRRLVGEGAIVRATQLGHLVGVLPDSSLLMTTAGRVPVGDPPHHERSMALLYRVSPDGEVGKLAEIPDLDIARQPTRYGGTTRVRTTVARFSRAAHAVLWGDVIVTSSAERYRLEWSDLTGEVAGGLVVQRPLVPVLDRRLAAEIAAGVAAYDQPMGEVATDLAEAKRLERERPHRDSLPPFDAIHAWPGQLLWVIDGYSATEMTWHATAFDARGRMLGRLAATGLPLPLLMQDDRLAVAMSDSDGVGRIEIYHIIGLATATATR